ncbi:MAG: RNA 2',3'-cyclic phosphodiesterase [Acidobacteria bacterium]|nr:RNA 2',3'-cyclic phosphodiesterase [Acidobacteriota bacterium]
MGVKKMRTFIAIPLTAECRRVLSEMQAALRESVSDVRWTAISSIHITLKFLGEINPALLPDLSQALRSSAVAERFTLSLDGLGVFPDLRRPRVIWCGLGGNLTALSALQAEVERACVRTGLAPEDRPFKPHLTLGRVQGRRNLPPAIDYIRIAATCGCEFEVARYCIYRSTLTPRGAVYDVMDAVELGAHS